MLIVVIPNSANIEEFFCSFPAAEFHNQTLSQIAAVETQEP